VQHGAAWLWSQSRCLFRRISIDHCHLHHWSAQGTISGELWWTWSLPNVRCPRIRTPVSHNVRRAGRVRDLVVDWQHTQTKARQRGDLPATIAFNRVKEIQFISSLSLQGYLTADPEVDGSEHVSEQGRTK
jgi:hypothetical protein